MWSSIARLNYEWVVWLSVVVSCLPLYYFHYYDYDFCDDDDDDGGDGDDCYYYWCWLWKVIFRRPAIGGQIYRKGSCTIVCMPFCAFLSWNPSSPKEVGVFYWFCRVALGMFLPFSAVQAETCLKMLGAALQAFMSDGCLVSRVRRTIDVLFPLVDWLTEGSSPLNKRYSRYCTWWVLYMMIRSMFVSSCFMFSCFLPSSFNQRCWTNEYIDTSCHSVFVQNCWTLKSKQMSLGATILRNSSCKNKDIVLAEGHGFLIFPAQCWSHLSGVDPCCWYSQYYMMCEIHQPFVGCRLAD